MSEEPTLFGAELRRLRTKAGLSLTRMAGLVHYSKGHLSKIETGHKQPVRDFAQRCDAVLEAGGELAALVDTRSPETPLPETDGDSEVWLMNLAPDGKSWFRPVDRRQMLATGAASLLAFGMGGKSAIAAEGMPLEAFRSIFDQLRQLGQTASPSVVLPALIANTHTLRGLAAQASAHTRGDILVLSARYAEYAGWMAQESGDDRAAMWWTDRAVETAAAGDDHDLAMYALVRRGLITLYRDDAEQTIELASQAQAAKVPPRIRGLAAQRVAQGHALAGDYDACMRTLDQARELLSSASPEATPVLGTANLDDPAAMVTGWCLHDLGRPQEATDILDREIQRVPKHALRSQARYGVRRALAHAAAGNIDHACALARDVLGVADTVRSATIATDLRRLARTLARFHAAPSVRELQPRLTASLRHHAA
jgi:transcriptional regulator with XRE-family HTH domain